MQCHVEDRAKTTSRGGAREYRGVADGGLEIQTDAHHMVRLPCRDGAQTFELIHARLDA